MSDGGFDVSLSTYPENMRDCILLIGSCEHVRLKNHFRPLTVGTGQSPILDLGPHSLRLESEPRSLFLQLAYAVSQANHSIGRN